MASYVLCKGQCKERFLKSRLIEFNKKYYCKKCLDEITSQIGHKDRLYEYIQDIYNIKQPSNFHKTQIRNALNDGYGYKDILIGLRYIYQILGSNFDSECGLGYAINHIEKAKAYYSKAKKINEENSKIIEEEGLPKELNISMKPHLNNEYRMKKVVNWKDFLK